jgi:hypothetical protein
MLPAAQLSPQLPSSPPAAMETDYRHQALLGWHSPPSNRSCLHETQVQELRARVGYLEAERNIELRAEIHQDFCKVFAEVRGLRDIVNNLRQQQKYDVFLRHRQEAQWTELENTIITQITEEKSDAIERELHLKYQLHDVINKKISTKSEQSSDRGESVEHSTTTPMEGVAIDGTMKPTIEEFSKNLESSGGLDQSRHAPNKPTIESSIPVNSPDDCQHSNMGGNSRDPPTGPRVWREKMGRKSRRSKKSNSTERNGSTRNSRLLQLQAEISNLKGKIKEKESRKPRTSRHTVTSEQGWTQIQRKQPTIRRPKPLKVNGRYKLVIGSADDGTRVECESVQSEMRSERNNRTLVNQLATDNN